MNRDLQELINIIKSDSHFVTSKRETAGKVYIITDPDRENGFRIERYQTSQQFSTTTYMGRDTITETLGTFVVKYDENNKLTIEGDKRTLAYNLDEETVDRVNRLTNDSLKPFQPPRIHLHV